MEFDPAEHPHRRFNPLTREWILVSAHRTKRPWQGQQEEPDRERRAPYDETCYLCPGNTRAGGERNPQYTSTYVFTNDFPAMLPNVPEAGPASHPLFRCEAVRGTSRVICFSPRHDLTLPEMSIDEIRAVIELWSDQITELGKQYRWVQIFENKGAMVGCSNPHPHCQIWAGSAIPTEVASEDESQRAYLEENGRVLLVDYAGLEAESQTRIVAENDQWMAVVPYWATWPFETLLMPRAPVQRLPELGAESRSALAEVLKVLLTRYDNLFETSFPYSLGWHGAPTDEGDYAHWQLHAHLLPPLLRSATVKKFMVGYELVAEPQRDLTAEQAAAKLRALPEVHYNAAARP